MKEHKRWLKITYSLIASKFRQEYELKKKDDSQTIVCYREATFFITCILLFNKSDMLLWLFDTRNDLSL